jgi:hypothetical protein
MTLTLRHFYIIFILAVVAAFTIHAHAGLKDWGRRVFDRSGQANDHGQDGLSEDGKIMGTTNCMRCLETRICGDLHQVIDDKSRRTLGEVCRTETARLALAINKCLKGDERNRWLSFLADAGHTDVVNFSSYKDTPDQLIAGGPTFKGSGLTVIGVPYFNHYQKLIAGGYNNVEVQAGETKAKPESAESAKQIDLDQLALEVSGNVDDEGAKDLKTCASNINKDMMSRFKDDMRDGKNKVKKTITPEIYKADLQKRLGLDAGFSSVEANRIQAICTANAQSQNGASSENDINHIGTEGN